LRHAVTAACRPALEAVRDALLGLQRQDLQGADSASLLGDVAELHALLGQVEGEWLRRVGEVHARGLGEAVGAGSTKAFLRGTLLMSPAEASRAVRTATALRTSCTATADALAAGTIGAGQRTCSPPSSTSCPQRYPRTPGWKVRRSCWSTPPC
jgi:hypothetical protein